MKKKISVGSMFAGVGGICLGFQKAQNEHAEFELEWANEIDEYACETYRTNFHHTMLEGNIAYVLKPENADDKELYEKMHEIMFRKPIDVLTAGFPCQSFSIAGEQKGFEDNRGILFYSVLGVIEQMDAIFHQKPRILFLENVKNLKSHDGGKTYRIIKALLEDFGYSVKDCVLNTCDYSDIPQHRERVYIVGFLYPEDANRFTAFDHIADYKKMHTKEQWRKIISGIIDESETNQKYFYTKEKYPHYFEPKEGPFKKNMRVNIAEEITEPYQFYQLRRGLYVRKNQSNVCPTLTANMGTGGHNVPLILTPHGIRKLTPKETFLLQGFPIDHGYQLPTEFKGRPFTDSALYKQAGNSVSVPIIQMLAEEILRLLE